MKIGISNPKHIGGLLQAVRHQKGWTQKQLAEAAAVSEGEVSIVERNLHDPRWATATKLFNAMNVRIELHVD